MTPQEFRDAIARLGLSQVGAARFLCANDRTARRWASGEQDVPPLVAKVLRFMVAKKVTPEQVDAAPEIKA